MSSDARELAERLRVPVQMTDRQYINEEREQAAAMIERLGKDAEIARFEMIKARCVQERVVQILTHIYALKWPEDMKLEDGREFRFYPPAEQMVMFLRGLWKAIDAIPTAIDAALSKDKP